MNIIFLRSGKLCGRNDVTSDKVNIGPEIKQKSFLEKNQDINSLCGS